MVDGQYTGHLGKNSRKEYSIAVTTGFDVYQLAVSKCEIPDKLRSAQIVSPDFNSIFVDDIVVSLLILRISGFKVCAQSFRPFLDIAGLSALVKNIIPHVSNIDDSSTAPKTGSADSGKGTGNHQEQKDQGGA